MEDSKHSPESPNPPANQVPHKRAQRTESEEITVGWTGYFDTVSKVLAGIAFAAWMIEEWTGIKILLFAAIFTGTADVFYLILHKVVKRKVGIIIGWCAFFILSWIIFRNSLTHFSAQSLYWVQIAVIASFAVSGWLLFLWTLRQPKRIDKPAASDLLFSVPERFVFMPETGYYVDSDSFLRICAKCLFPPNRKVSPLHETHGFGGLDGDEIVKIWSCGQCGEGYADGPNLP